MKIENARFLFACSCCHKSSNFMISRCRYAALAAWLFNAVKCNFNNGVSNKERLCTLWGLHGVRSFRYKVVSIQVDSIPSKVVSRHHQSRFDIPRKSIQFESTQLLCSQLLSGPTGAKIAISVSQ